MNKIHRWLPARIRQEWFLAISVPTCVVLHFQGDALWGLLPSWPLLLVMFAWLFVAILGSARAVVRHADHLAEQLGEPYGTLILTLSVTVIEVTSISAVMLHGEANPTLARDTLLAVVMIILNGMVGLSLLLGGWRHREQHHNLQGANIYLGAIVPLVVLSLVMPNFTQTTRGATLAFAQQIFLVLVSIGLYATFLVVQTGRHSGYFNVAHESESRAPAAPRPRPSRQIVWPSIALLANLLPALFLAEKLSRPIDHLIETLHAPAAVGGVIVAVLVATPESLGAVRAALSNQLQRSVNISLGSALSTIGLTIPAMVLISELSGQNMVLGVQHADLVMLLLTIAVSMVTFASGRTNIIQGAVHLVLFAAYILLIFQD